MTTYAVCPQCRTVHAVDDAHTLSAAQYRTWEIVRLRPGRIDMMDVAARMDVHPRTAQRYVAALADAGLVRRVPMGGKYAKRQRHTYEVEARETGQARQDPGAAGEQENAPVRAGAG